VSTTGQGPVPDLLGTIEAPVFQTAAFTHFSAEDMAEVFAGRARERRANRSVLTTVLRISMSIV
jgi:hypothetical protein